MIAMPISRKVYFEIQLGETNVASEIQDNP